jgi:hypothetical protein
MFHAYWVLSLTLSEILTGDIHTPAHKWYISILKKKDYRKHAEENAGWNMLHCHHLQHLLMWPKHAIRILFYFLLLLIIFSYFISKLNINSLFKFSLYLFLVSDFRFLEITICNMFSTTETTTSEILMLRLIQDTCNITSQEICWHFLGIYISNKSIKTFCILPMSFFIA